MTTPTSGGHAFSAAAPHTGTGTAQPAGTPEAAVVAPAPTAQPETQSKKNGDDKTTDKAQTDNAKNKTPPKGFVQQKETMTQGEFMETNTPSQEVVISQDNQHGLSEAIRQYDNQTQRMADSATEYAPSNRDQAISKLRNEIDTRSRDKEATATFYEAKEVLLGLSIVEDMMLQEAAAIAYNLTQNGTTEGTLTLPRTQDVVFRKRLFERAADALTGPFEALGIKITGMQGDKLTFQCDPESAAWITKRVQSGDFLSRNVTDQDRISRIMEAQKLRYSIYQEIGLDLKQADQLAMLSLGPDNFDPAAGPQAHNSLLLHNKTVDHLRNILKRKHPGKSLLDLDPATRTQTLLDAREIASSEIAIDVGKAILEEKGTEMKGGVRVLDIDERANKLKGVHKYSPEEIQLRQEELQNAEAARQAARSLVELYHKLESSETEGESIKAAVKKHNTERARYNSLEAKHSPFITMVEGYTEPLPQQIQRLKQETESALKAFETTKTQADYQVYKGKENQLNKANQEQALYTELVNKLIEAEAKMIEAEAVKDLRILRRTEIQDLIKDKLGQATFDIGQLDQYIKNANDAYISAKQLYEKVSKNEPVGENATEAQGIEKLSSTIKNDYITIIDSVTSGKVTLTELSDTQNGYDAILELLWHSNKDTANSIPKELQESMLSRFELALQIAKHYGIDLTGDGDFSQLNMVRNSIRDQQRIINQLISSGAVQADIDAAKTVLDPMIDQYRNLQVQSRNLLERLLPEIRIHGRWEAGNLMQRILESRVKDTLEGYLLDPTPYHRATRPVTPVTPPGAPEVKGIEIPVFKNIPAGRLEIQDSQPIVTLMKRLQIEPEPETPYRQGLLYKQDINGIQMESAFLTTDDAVRQVVFVERLIANDRLFQALPDTIVDALNQGWSAEVINYFYGNTGGKKDRKNISNETITTTTVFNNFRVLVDTLNGSLPEASQGIQEAGYTLLTSKSAQDRLDLFAGFGSFRMVANGVGYRVNINLNNGDLMISSPALGAPQKVEDFLNTPPAGFTNDDQARLRMRIGIQALDALRVNI